MPYVEMKPEDVFALLEGQENVLEGEQKKADAFYRQFICPTCGSANLSKRFDPRHAFSDPNWIIPRATLYCNDCRCHFDPHSGLILDTGNPARLPPPVHIINPSSSSSGE
jgi:hypothetical protein